MKIIPWEDIIIIKDAPEEKTAQGVLLGDAGKYDEKKVPEKGIIVAIGPLSDSKKKLPEDLKEGDLLFYERYSGNRISDGGETFNFIRTKYVMGYKKI